MKIAFFFLLLSCSTSAWDSGKCSTMLNDGMYKKYKWGGVGDSNLNAITAETKRVGSSTASINVSTENSTAISDTKYTTNVSRSNSQSSSSYGECSLFGLKEKKQERKQYLAQNLDQIKIDAASGGGPHLEVLAWLSLCEGQAIASFNKSLQKKFGEVFLDSNDITVRLDQMIEDGVDLKAACFSFAGI